MNIGLIMFLGFWFGGCAYVGICITIKKLKMRKDWQATEKIHQKALEYIKNKNKM